MSRKHDVEGQLSLFDWSDNQVQKPKAGTITQAGQFVQCKECWCYTCEHSTVGGGVARKFVDGERICINIFCLFLLYSPTT